MFPLHHMQAIAALRAHATACSRMFQRSQLYQHIHVREVTIHALCLAVEYGLEIGDQATMRAASELHDVGKIPLMDVLMSVEGKVLEKDSREFELIKHHSELGAQGIEAMAMVMPSIAETFYVVADIVRAHHERWDGLGYPRGLAGWRIPLMARMLAIADSAKAMTTPERQWRAPMTLKDMLIEVRHCAGTQFDPEIAELYCQMIEHNRISLPVAKR